VVVIAVLVVLGVALVLGLDLGERLAAHSRAYEQLQLDELPFIAVIVVIGVIAFSARRWQEAIRSLRAAEQIAGQLRERDAERDAEVRGQAFERRLHSALDMAQSEPAALTIVEEALIERVPDNPIEVLLADSSRAHLTQAATSDRATYGPGCPVPTPYECPAVRRARTLTFATSEQFDACPFLRDRSSGNRSAVCVPLSIAGQPVGVMHATAPVEQPLGQHAISAMEHVALKAGDRIGVIRAFARSESQAARDALTGLLNRRSLEEQVHRLLRVRAPHAVVYADLDHFKRVNDTHGHESGDRALRLFTRTLRAAARQHDLIARWGGEEFLIVVPQTSANQAAGLAERVREGLTLALANGTTPHFTASFGVSDSLQADEFDAVVALADAALLAAKRAGRNRVVIAGQEAAVNTTAPATESA